MRLVVIDTETTGLDPKEHAVVEIAALEIIEIDDGYGFGDLHHCFVNPGRAIPPEASAVHHIVDNDVADAVALDVAISNLGLVGAETIFVAHNAPFDRSFLPELSDARWIDTCQVARHAFVDAPGYGNQVLRYYLKLQLPYWVIDTANTLPHRAGFDTIVTGALLCRLLDFYPVEGLITLSNAPAVLRTCHFGKHRGQRWVDLPIDYLQWASRQDFDPNVAHTIKHEIARRQNGARQ
jgi:exodeoxyribonuclease X